MKCGLSKIQSLLDTNLNCIHFCLWMLSEGHKDYVYRLDYTYELSDPYPSYIANMTSPRRHLLACRSEFNCWLSDKDWHGFDWRNYNIFIKDCLKQLHKERRDLRTQFNLAKKESAELRFIEACQKQNAARFKAFHEYVRMRKLNNCIGYKSVSWFYSWFVNPLTFSSMYGKENVNCFTETYQTSSLI